MKLVTGLFAALILMSFSALGVSAAQADENRKPITQGINHLGLTVKDLDKSASFFIDTLGWRRAGGDPDYPAIFVTDGKSFVTLWRVEDPASATEFNRRKNVGLHHLAFTVNSLKDLHALHALFLETEGVRIEFAPEFMGAGPTTHMMIREPSGNRLEFVVPGGLVRAESKANSEASQ